MDQTQDRDQNFIEMLKKKYNEYLDHTVFVKEYAQYNSISEKDAVMKIWDAKLFDKYNACHECGRTDDVKVYYCGNYGCGKGSWCRKFEYRYCSDCHYKRLDE